MIFDGSPTRGRDVHATRPRPPGQLGLFDPPNRQGQPSKCETVSHLPIAPAGHWILAFAAPINREYTVALA